MRTFELRVEDDRSLDPTTVFVLAESEERARRHAEVQLEQSLHHRCVHVHEQRQRLFSVRRDDPHGIVARPG
jgi:hypothetical protein